MGSKIYEKLIKECSLESRLNALNQLNYIDLITDMGYRKDVMWTEAEDYLLQILCETAAKASREQIEVFEEWIADGSPK